jgi:hypothetical protein
MTSLQHGFKCYKVAAALTILSSLSFSIPGTFDLPDMHPDGLQVAAAHYDRHLRITRLAAKA